MDAMGAPPCGFTDFRAAAHSPLRFRPNSQNQGKMSFEGGSIDWFDHGAMDETKAVALVIHGLNLDPGRMKAIIAVLNGAGIDALRLSLRGHGKNFLPKTGVADAKARLESLKLVSYAIWREEALSAYGEARRHARVLNAPLFLVGFSYGGLIGLDLLASRPEVGFDRMALFAPAVSLRWCDYLLRIFSPFPLLVIPTLSARDYTANPGIPMAAYNALFETLRHLKAHASPKLNQPARVFIDPKDELISISGLRKFAKRARLDRWIFHPVEKDDSAASRIMRHIMVDEQSLGREAWERIRKTLAAHLLGDLP